MSPLATPKFSIVNFQLSIGSHRLPDKREFAHHAPNRAVAQCHEYRQTVSPEIASGRLSAPAAICYHVSMERTTA